METNKIEEKVYSAFKTDKELLSRLAEGVESIFHIQVPAIEKTQYPCIVYDLVSCPPIFWSDNLVREYLASFRIWILTKDGNYDEIADDIQRIMVNLGAVRYQTAKYRENKEINKDFYGVKSITLRLYFEHSFDSLPFSLIFTKKKDNSKITLYITIGIIILSCIICALAIYCLSKKISENARLRQRALFEIAMAHQNGEENDDEEEEQKRIETENQLKIKFALKHSLKPKKFMKKYGVKDGNTCTICIEDFKENKSRVSITPCKHVFHYQCLSNWMVKNVMNPKCPNCNFNLIQDVKDSDIKDMVVNPERINVTNVKVNNMVNGENNINNNAHNQNVNVQNEEITRNVNVNNNTESNTNTEERNLRTSSNVVIIRRNN